MPPQSQGNTARGRRDLPLCVGAVSSRVGDRTLSQGYQSVLRLANPGEIRRRPWNNFVTAPPTRCTSTLLGAHVSRRDESAPPALPWVWPPRDVCARDPKPKALPPVVRRFDHPRARKTHRSPSPQEAAREPPSVLTVLIVVYPFSGRDTTPAIPHQSGARGPYDTALQTASPKTHRR